MFCSFWISHCFPASEIDRLLPIPIFSACIVTLVPPDKGPKLGSAGGFLNLGIYKN